MKNSVNPKLIVSGILLAAGSSKRLGSPKQLLEWKDQYLINYVIHEILKSKIDELYVILGEQNHTISQIIDPRAKIVFNNNWAKGKSSSIKIGIAHLSETIQGAIFFVVDQPFINFKIINKLLWEFYQSPDSIIAPRIKGILCNPVIFGRKFINELNNLSGEEGGKTIIDRSRKVKWVDSDDEKLLIDIDTQIDYNELITNNTS